MSEILRQRARELGFNDCRITTAEPPESGTQLQRWLAERQHGEMAYLERNAHKRLDPRQVLPGAKSIVMLAASYHSETQGVPNGPQPVLQLSPEIRPRSDAPTLDAPTLPRSHAPTGLVARYARYQDYHDVMGERLRVLTLLLGQLGGEETRSLWYVDTGPVLERDLAQRAGLGFIGKHTNLISRQLGNWTFLAEILTTLELKPDPPEKNRCGSCTRCITACPTGAIRAPFQLDARLCISYLTIELKGPIPIELRPAMGNRVFGCDDCLAVCPWNRFAKDGALMQAHSRPELATPDLVEMLSLDDAGFKRRFDGTPILRVKRRGLLRNVCVALGNIGDATALPDLQKAARDAEPLVAEHARWAIVQIQHRLCSSAR
jgi:epoxyqueuosine reductase